MKVLSTIKKLLVCAFFWFESGIQGHSNVCGESLQTQMPTDRLLALLDSQLEKLSQVAKFRY